LSNLNLKKVLNKFQIPDSRLGDYKNEKISNFGNYKRSIFNF
jgi:hypothetical protein